VGYLGSFEVGSGILDRAETVSVALLHCLGLWHRNLLFDGIGEAGGDLDNVDGVGLQAGSHFVLGPQRDELPGGGDGGGSVGSHCGLEVCPDRRSRARMCSV
jgi:hypothetical protein